MLPLLVALVSWFVIPSYADTFRLDAAHDPYGTIDHGIGGVGGPDSGPAGANPYPLIINGHREDAGTILMHDTSAGGRDYDAYCIDLTGIRHISQTFTSGPRQFDQIAYILNHYFPAPGAYVAARYPNGAPDYNDEAAAIQIAIWGYSDGVTVNSASDASHVTADPWVGTLGWLRQRAVDIHHETDAAWAAWAAQQQAIPQVSMHLDGSTVAPGSNTLHVNVGGGAPVPDGTPITVTVTSPAGTVNGQRSAVVGASGGGATLTAHMDAPGAFSASASVSVVSQAYFRLTPPDMPNDQLLILASGLPVSGTGTVSASFVGAPHLTITKLVADNNGAPATSVDGKPGDTLTYTLSYANDGNATATGAVVTDDLSKGGLGLLDLSTVVLHGGTSSSLDAAHRTATWQVGDVAAGDHGTVSFTARVPAALSDNGSGVDFCNVGSISAGGGAGGSSNQACAHIVTTPHLVAVKVVDATLAQLGQTLHYSVKVTNDGNRNLTGLVFSDVLSGHNLELLTDVAPVAPLTWDASTRTLSANIASLPVGDSVTFSFSAAVPSTGLTHGVDTCFTNVASAGGGNSGGTTTSPPVTTCVHPEVCTQPTPTLTMTGPQTLTAGQASTYTVTAGNGGTQPVSPVSVAVTVPSGFAITGTSPAAAVTGGVATFDVGSLAAGQNVTLSVTVTVPSTASGAAAASAVMTATDHSTIPDCPHPSASVNASTSGNVVVGQVQGVQSVTGVVAVPVTGSGGTGLLRSSITGLALLVSGLIVVTGWRRDPHRL